MERLKHIKEKCNILHKVIDKIKNIIGAERFDDINIFIETNEKLSNYITLKNFLMLVTCAIKDGDKFYSEIFLEEAFLA